MVLLVEQVADAYIALIKQLQWKRVAVISHYDDFNINVSTPYIMCDARRYLYLESACVSWALWVMVC